MAINQKVMTNLFDLSVDFDESSSFVNKFNQYALNSQKKILQVSMIVIIMTTLMT